MKKAKAVKATPKKTKKTTSVTVHTSKPSNKDMVWSNASQIMTSSREDIKTAVAQQMMNLATAVFKLPPQGVTILANQPYINKTGWKMKMREYYEDKYRIRTDWKHLATPNEKYAVCEAIIEVKDSKGVWDEVSRAIGEANEASIKLQAVKQTLNMMAETRAKNRAMSEYIGARALEDAVKMLTAMRKKNEVSDDQANVITEAARVTAEEMNAPETRTVNSEKAFSFVEKLKVEMFKRGYKTGGQAIDFVNQVTDAQLSSMNEVDESLAKVVLAEVIKKPLKK
jgi:hypothetical protein